MNKKIHVKTGDTVMIISGKDRGKVGKIKQVSPKEGKVIVEGLQKIRPGSPVRIAEPTPVEQGASASEKR